MSFPCILELACSVSQDLEAVGSTVDVYEPNSLRITPINSKAEASIASVLA